MELRPGWYWTADGQLIECRVLIVAGRVATAIERDGTSVPVKPEDVMLKASDEREEP